MFSPYHILDVLNVLGGRRNIPTPDPQYPNNQFILQRGEGLPAVRMQPFYTGSLTTQWTENGTGQEIISPSSQSGSVIFTNGDPDTDIIFIGNITKVVSGSGCIFAAANNTLTELDISNAPNMNELDLRNGTLLSVLTVATSNNIKTIYALANEIGVSNSIISIISTSTITDGVLWINPNDTYATSVIAAAEAKGWSVYNL